jgi:hypothetical protein
MPLPPSMGGVSPDTSHQDREQEDRKATKIGEKPMVRYNMTHTTMKSRQPRDKTVGVVNTSTPEESTNEITTAAGVMPEEVDMNSEAQAEHA